MCDFVMAMKWVIGALFFSAILLDLAGRIEHDKAMQYAKIELPTCPSYRYQLQHPPINIPDHPAFLLEPARPMLYIGDKAMTATQLSKLSAGINGMDDRFHWFVRSQYHHADGDKEELCREHHQHKALTDAPPDGRALDIAQQLQTALKGAWLPGGDTDAKGRALVITNLLQFDTLEACLLALGVQTKFWSLATLEECDWNEMPYGGFCYRHDEFDGMDPAWLEESEPNLPKIKRVTQIMANNLQQGFELNFSYDEVVCGPILYGGYVDGHIVGVLSMRVST